jgi:hypothetical protein
MKIRPVGANMCHADRRTKKHDEANSRFSTILQSGIQTNGGPAPQVLAVVMLLSLFIENKKQKHWLIPQ